MIQENISAPKSHKKSRNMKI